MLVLVVAGDVPLHESIRSHADEGTPIVFTEPEGPMTQHYQDIAEKALLRLDEIKGKGGAGGAGPSIVME